MATPAIALDLPAGPRPGVAGNKTTEPHWLIGSGNLAQAFWIAGALFVLPIALMLHVVVTDLTAQIEFADKERLGAEYIAPLAFPASGDRLPNRYRLSTGGGRHYPGEPRRRGRACGAGGRSPSTVSMAAPCA